MSYEQTAKMSVQELKAIDSGAVFNWSKCSTCGNECIISLSGHDAFDKIKAYGLVDHALPMGNNDGIKTECHACQKIASDAHERKHVPRLARKLLKHVHATYKCPVYQCGEESTSKALLYLHMVSRHDTYYLKRELKDMRA